MNSSNFENNNPAITPEDQKRLEACCIALIGLGNAGIQAAELLARSGVGKLILVDRSVFGEAQGNSLLSNRKTEGRPVVYVLEERLKAISSCVEVRYWKTAMDAENVQKIIAPVSAVLTELPKEELLVLKNACEERQIALFSLETEASDSAAASIMKASMASAAVLKYFLGE